MKKSLSIVSGNEVASTVCSSKATILNSDAFSVNPKTFLGRAAVITLGCAKNQVDSEVMLGALKAKGFELVSEVSEADVAIVNTCGFLESSVKESIDCVLDVSDLKENGKLRKLIVAGCAVERYRNELINALPEVDSFITTDDLLKVGEIATGEASRVLDEAARPYFIYDETMPRALSTRSHTAYVKVSEGCNRPCTFCIIPKIRGEMRSRSIISVVNEIKDLAKVGVKEVNLVAQDLTSFGTDTKGGDLTELLRKIDESGAVPWVRLLYAYPVGTDEKLITAIRDLPSICEYLDIPLQHSSEDVLKIMKRPIGQFSPRRIVEKIRSVFPQIHIRTTFIVGFPGETEEDIADLESFVREGHFSSVGVFTYSKEKGTPSFDLPNHLSEKVKSERRARVMKAQQDVVHSKLSALVDQEIPVLLEGVHEESDLLLTGRARFQAPEVDGIVIINDKEGDVDSQIGRVGMVRITEVLGYDLVGTLVS